MRATSRPVSPAFLTRYSPTLAGTTNVSPKCTSSGSKEPSALSTTTASPSTRLSMLTLPKVAIVARS